jgi:hypothetical protein
MSSYGLGALARRTAKDLGGVDSATKPAADGSIDTLEEAMDTATAIPDVVSPAAPVTPKMVPGAGGGGNGGEGPSGATTGIAVLATLVPGEALLVMTATIAFFSDAAASAESNTTTITKVTDLPAAKVVVVIGFAVAFVSWAYGRFKTFKIWTKWEPADALRFWMAPAAFLVWLLVTYTPVFNAVFGVSVPQNRVQLIGWLGGGGLGGLAALVHFKVPVKKG